jgi:7-cyano-7-deazaguanine synthase
MDSISLAWWKRPDVAITIDYGQLSADAEIVAATQICKQLCIAHHIIRFDARSLGSGDMAGTAPNEFAPETDWWPYRNQLLATLAAMKSIELGVTHLWFGAVKTDVGHSDGTQPFFDAITNLMKIQEGSIIVEAPAIHLTTAELVKVSGIKSGFLAWSHSCHKNNYACGNCRGCNKYSQVYEEIGYDLEKIT